MTDTTKLTLKEALEFNLCEGELDLLNEAVLEDSSVDNYYDELRQAAFDQHWDGESPEEEFKEECWEVSYDNYQSYFIAAKEHPLHVAAMSDVVEWAEQLLHEGHSVRALDNGSEGRTPLEYATERNNLGVQKVLIAAERKLQLDARLPKPEADKLAAACSST